MCPPLRVLLAPFLLILAVSLTPPTVGAPAPSNELADQELPFGALTRIGPTHPLFAPQKQPEDPRLLQIAFSPDGEFLVALGHSNHLVLLDAKTGKFMGDADCPSKASFTASSFAIAPNSKAIAFDNGTVLSLPNCKAMMDFDPKLQNPGKIAYSPDSKRIAVAYPESIGLFSATTGENILRKDTTFQTVSSIAFAPDGKSFVVAGDRESDKGKTVHAVVFYDAEKLRETNSFAYGAVRSLVFTGKKLTISYDNGSVDVRNLENERVAATYRGHRADLPFAAWDADKEIMTTAGIDGTVRFWKSEKKEERRIKIAEERIIQLFALSPDGKTLAAGRSNGLIQLWDLKTEKMKAIIGGHVSAITALAFSPDGKFLATGGVDHTARLWNTGTGKDLGKLFDHDGTVNALVFTPNGKELISAGMQFRAWDLEGDKEARRFGSERSNTGMIALSPDGKRVAFPLKNSGVALWNPADDKAIHDFKEKTIGGQAICLAFSPDGKRIASGSAPVQRIGRDREGLVAIWDVDNRKLLHQFGGHPLTCETGVIAVAFAPDGKGVIYAENKTISLSDVESGNEYRRFDGHTDPITALALSPDGRVLASADKDGVTYLWEAHTGTQMRLLSSTNKPVTSLAFSRDGRRLASGRADGTALIWPVYFPIDSKATLKAKLTEKELDARWKSLTPEESPEAYVTTAALAHAPADSVPYLKEKLIEYASPEPKELDKLLSAVLDELPPECDEAYRKLQDLEELANDAVRAALKKSPSENARKRLQRLLDDREEGVHYVPQPARLAIHRSLAVLELIGDADCVAILKQLAKGNAKDPIVRDAEGTLERLAK
jgi:WD40 repeat protein